jgi:hypothetical protein
LRTLDLIGLCDRTMAKGLFRLPATVSDYVFGEVQPEWFLVHGFWRSHTQLPMAWPFGVEYRKINHKDEKLVEAIRTDLIDPVAPAIQRMTATVNGARLSGATALAWGDRVTLFLHAWQTTTANPKPLVVRRAGPDQPPLPPVAWHMGHDVRPGPVGGAVLARAQLDRADFPLMIDGTSITLDTPPFAPGYRK